MPEDPPGFLPAGGNYRDLLSYKKSEVIYDFTFRFCEKFLKRGRSPEKSYETYRTYTDTRPPEVLSNIAICLIHQANYLLDQQIRRLEKDFLKKGGLRENMTRARLEYRKRSKE